MRSEGNQEKDVWKTCFAGLLSVEVYTATENASGLKLSQRLGGTIHKLASLFYCSFFAIQRCFRGLKGKFLTHAIEGTL